MKKDLQIFLVLMVVICCGTACSEKNLSEYPASTEMDSASMNTDPNEVATDELLDLFVAGEVSANVPDEEGNVAETFTINDLDMGGEDYFSYSVGERVDLDNDGERELVLNGPYGGMYLDARDGQVYVLAKGDGTAEALGFTEFDGKTWIVYSDDSHGGRNTYDLYCYDGNGSIADEFQLAKWFWNVAEDEPGTEYEYRGEKIDKKQYDSLYWKIIAPMYTRQKCLYGGEVWGTIESVHREFPEGTERSGGKISYYYEMEKFYVKADLPKSDAVNAVLQHIYDNYESEYLANAEWYVPVESEEDLAEDITSDMSEDIQEDSCEYAKWYLTQLAYAGEDYISLWYNDIAYMGGAHPYSHFDGITIDCRTGMEAAATDIVGMEENEILKKVSEEIGLADIATWDEIDFYLTDSEIVFFYRMPGYWDDVVWERK